ncbi:MAG: NADH-quinone oxidoreductase subunit NuoK [Nitrospinae bacterium]|nr:NADH-quinone oxidoreductase subunit NuoK [Nitrospinota bacterium]
MVHLEIQVLAFLILTIGIVGFLVRKNPIVMFMSIELMLNAVNLSLIGFADELKSVDGQIFSLIVMTVAAAEVVVGLAIIVVIFRVKKSTDVDSIDLLKG